MSHTRARAAGLIAAIVLPVALATGCTGAQAAPRASTSGSPGPAAAAAGDGTAGSDAAASPTPGTPCAELPAASSDPREVEGWWNATPADADGGVLTDPATWPEPLMREHPRVALVDAASAAVVATYDRVACGPDPSYVPVRDAAWPAAGVLVVDMGTGQVLDTLAAS